ncbi:MAG: VCBS repeat-containing protein [Alphaproteobacteria bacterium]|nr:VCBS repeat-containing protein [Alphaproteobacteria bacterium]
MRPALLPLVFVLAACSEYEVNPKDDNPVILDDTSSPPFDTEDTGEPPPNEECDGEDNDLDGVVDEGFNDVDADGIADCQDGDCEVDAPPEVSEVDESCAGSVNISDPPARPWSWVIEWEWLQGAVYSTPAVGDLDQDGVPEVVFTSARSGGQLHVLDGATGAEEWSLSGVDYQSGVALGDLDGDGLGDILYSTGSCYQPHTLVAVDYAGNTMWSTATGNACETYPYLTDLEGDGTIEILFNQFVLDAQGNILHSLSVTGGDPWGAPAAADLDQDGTQEILLSSDVFDANGNWMFTCGSGGVGSFPQPVNADSDAEGELLVAGNGAMTLCDSDGQQIWRQSYSSYGTAVAVADFDNDSEQEFAFAKLGQLRLVERDGTNLWTTSMQDNSGLAGTTSWDIDMDGVPEVIFADEVDILVYNGANGTVVIREPSHGSVTLAETPAAADVDGDGSGELLYGSNSGRQGITVIGGADGDWPYARPVYNQYGYYGDNINDDMSLPTPVPDPWLTDANLFRGQPSALYVAGQPNLRAEITDVCASSCEDDGLVRVSAVVWNSGGASVPAGTAVVLYGRPAGVNVPLVNTALTQDLDPESSEGFSFEVDVSLAGTVLTIEVDGDELVTECDETDNLGYWADVPCAQ